MRRDTLVSLVLGTATSIFLGAYAHGSEFSARLSGFAEVPLSILSNGKGRLELDLNKHAQTIDFKLTYSGLATPVTQAHIHFGKRHAAGGIMVFFCTNLGNGPAGTPGCPSGGGTVTGKITAAGVVGPNAQNVTPGDFNALVAAIVSNTAYANVHTTNFPAGEIRGQIRSGDGDDDH